MVGLFWGGNFCDERRPKTHPSRTQGWGSQEGRSKVRPLHLGGAGAFPLEWGELGFGYALEIGDGVGGGAVFAGFDVVYVF